MRFISDFYGLLGFVTGLRRFLRDTISTEEARRYVQQAVRDREKRFLEKVKVGVFGYARSPYSRLFAAAGCEFGDIEHMVRESGLEAALQKLLESGVYVTWEELRGIAPAVRGSQTFYFQHEQFDNPTVKSHLQTTSGGTSGVPVRGRIDLDELRQSAPDWAVWFAAHDWMHSPLLFWTPARTGLAVRYLRCAKFGKPYVKSFAMVKMPTWQARLRSTIVHGLLQILVGLGKPEMVALDQAERVGEYLLAILRDGKKPLLVTSPSAAASISLAMQERRQSLEGVSFLLGAEPLSEARKEAIEASGARAIPTYGTSECGGVGAQFPGATVGDEVHIFRNAYAVIQRSGGASCARSILLTNLLPAGRKVLINAEIGDSAVLEIDRVSRVAHEFDYHQRMHTIRSFLKITAWGVTLPVALLYPLLERTLPEKFGGRVGDYQLLESEGGVSKLRLLVHPEVGPVNPSVLERMFLEEVSKIWEMDGRRDPGFRTMVEMLRSAGALEIERRRPVATSRGKVLPVLPQSKP